MKHVSARCCKRRLWIVIGVIFLLCSLVFNQGVALASETDEQLADYQGYEASESIVQVVLLYQDTNNVYHVLQSGSGILVGESTVITNNHLTYMSDELKAETGAYLTELLGYTVTFIPTGESSQNVASYSVAIVQEADIYNIASVELASNDWDFAILSLSSKSDKTPAVLGRSEQLKVEQQVSAVGLPTVDYTNAVSFTGQDVISTSGYCVSLEGGNITFDARLEMGSSGGALVDKYGRVMGIATYRDSAEGQYTALPIDNVKGYLERAGVAYTEDDKSVEDIENAGEADDGTDNFKTDKNELNRVIMEAELIYEEGNDNKYTDDSFRNLRLNLDYAKITYDDPMAQQTTIDSDTANLRAAIDGLEAVETKSNVGIIVAISIGGVLLVALIVLLIVVLVKNSKKRKERKKEAEKIKTLNQQAVTNVVGGAAAQQPQPSFQSFTQYNDGAYAVNQNQVLAADQSLNTSVLMDSNPGTTILTTYARQTVNGFIYSQTTGETIYIDVEEFVIGKAMEQVNYAVMNNATISRKHAKIIRKYDEFFIEDLGSTNFTYVNGKRVAPGDKRVLQDRDIIHLSDEEFVFMLGN